MKRFVVHVSLVIDSDEFDGDLAVPAAYRIKSRVQAVIDHGTVREALDAAHLTLVSGIVFESKESKS